MPEAVTLHVVVANLTHSGWPQRFPAQVLAAVPAAARPGEALHLLSGRLLRDRPIAPWMVNQRILTQRRQLSDQLLTNRVREGGGDTNVMQGALGVVQAQ